MAGYTAHVAGLAMPSKRKEKEKTKTKTTCRVSNLHDSAQNTVTLNPAPDAGLPLPGYGCNILIRPSKAKKKMKKKKKKEMDCKKWRALSSGLSNSEFESSGEQEKRSILEWVEMSLSQRSRINGCSDGHDDRSCFADGKSNGAEKAFDGENLNCRVSACPSSDFSFDCGASGHSRGYLDDGCNKLNVPSFLPPTSDMAYRIDNAFCNHVCLDDGSSKDTCASRDRHGAAIPNMFSKQSNSATMSKVNDYSESNKRKREDDKVLQYVMKRSIIVKPPCMTESPGARTAHTVVVAWGKRIPVTVTNDALVIQQWIEKQCGSLFGLDVEWKPNREKGKVNKVALLQLCGEHECLIVQMLLLDRIPAALVELLLDPLKALAGVGVHGDARRLLRDHGLECQGGLELTTLAVERLKREELQHVGLKVLVQEVLGLHMEKPKTITLSNWAKLFLNRAQIEYACIDAWASYAVSQKLMEQV